jgi:hypothetical protein
MRKPDAKKESYWRSVLLRQQKSGLTVRQFCLEQGLSQGSFYGWKRKIANRDRQADVSPARKGRARRKSKSVAKSNENTAVFVPVHLNAAANGLLEVVHPRGHVVRVPSVFDQHSLRQVLDVLDQQGEGSHAFGFQPRANLSGPRSR